MRLDDYLDFLRPDDIRVAGTRVGIENVLLDYLHRGLTAEQIAERYPSVSLEQVYATILYYLHDMPTVEACLNAYLEWQRSERKEHAQNPTPGERRLRQVKVGLAGCSPEVRATALRRLAEERKEIAAVDAAW
jgi:uncharacterized protein (DUF433 family)